MRFLFYMNLTTIARILTSLSYYMKMSVNIRYIYNT